MRKKLFIILLALCLALSLAACSSKENDQSQESTVVENNSNQDDTQSDSSNDNTRSINVFDGVRIIFYGDTGSGVARVELSPSYIDYDHSNSDITAFLNDIDFVYEESHSLKNKDTLKISLSYSHDDADSLGIVISEESKEYTVYGLYDESGSVTSADKLDPDQIRAAVEEELDETESIVSAYATTMAHINYDGDTLFTDEEEFVYAVHCIVTDGKHYYTYEAGIAGADPVSVRRWWDDSFTDENALVEDLGYEELQKVF